MKRQNQNLAADATNVGIPRQIHREDHGRRPRAARLAETLATPQSVLAGGDVRRGVSPYPQNSGVPLPVLRRTVNDLPDDRGPEEAEVQIPTAPTEGRVSAAPDLRLFVWLLTQHRALMLLVLLPVIDLRDWQTLRRLTAMT